MTIKKRDESGRIVAHEPTDKSRTEVSALKSFGHTHDEICTYFDIDEKTLAKYYKRELETAIVRANAQVANKLFNKAVNGDDLYAQIFWLKTKARWRTEERDEEDAEKRHDELKEELRKVRAELAEKNKRDY